MISYRGKYNSAYVMVDEIDETTVSQIYGFLNHPAFKDTHIAIMPDCHAGAGAVIGYTAKMNNYIIPNLVGVDIGCGIDAYNLGQQDMDFQAFDTFIRENIPSGFNVRDEPLGLSQNLAKQIGVVCNEIPKIDEARAFNSIGTLGGGNHFIELNLDPDGNTWLAIHSGSRKFGLDIANYHQQRAKDLLKEMFIGDAYKKLEFMPLDKGGRKYLYHMTIAQEYAKNNRWQMVKIIGENYFEIDIRNAEKVCSVHNYINFQDNIVRKGAISAHEGERVIIPLNMRDGSIVGTGKGNSKWNFSAPHGAGRIMSRTKAKKELSLEEFEKQMNGIWTSCVHKKTLDESPMAYKDKSVILDVLEETVGVEFVMKPVYNFKGS